MKAFDIAIKDMTRSFRSAFALVFMFGVPLLMTGMFYLMFGGSGNNSHGFTIPVTKVVVANLDQGGAGFSGVRAQVPGGAQANSMGDVILSHLQEKSFAKVMEVTRVDSAAAALSAVDNQSAGVALIIPADFSAGFSNPSGQTSIELYKDPTLTIGPSIVQSILNQLMDSFSGASIAVKVAIQQTGSTDPALAGQVIQEYVAGLPSGDASSILLDVRNANVKKQPVNTLLTVIGPIMGWLTIFYAFFTGASTAQSILREDEDGTLPRLFTTPTTHSTILGGKFLAVGLTTIVQMTVLIILGRAIFAIPWGSLISVTIVILGTILAAASFGIFLNSMLRSTKQSGLVFGGLMTVMGMLGGLPIFVGMASPSSSALNTVALVVPQGWAVHGLLQAMNNASLNAILISFLVLVGWAVLFFVVGVLRFQKRFE
jgi:ABC-2 type transport system permease protein